MYASYLVILLVDLISFASPLFVTLVMTVCDAVHIAKTIPLAVVWCHNLNLIFIHFHKSNGKHVAC